MIERWWLVTMDNGRIVLMDKSDADLVNSCIKDGTSSVTIDDVYGAEHTIVVSKINTIEQTTPETRRAEREHDAQLEEEKGFMA